MAAFPPLPPTVSMPSSQAGARATPRRHAGVVAVLAIGLSALVALEGPRAWGPFSRLLLPVLALSLAATFAAALMVPRRLADRVGGYPLLCSAGGLVGALLGTGLGAVLRGKSVEVMATRPISWHLVAGGVVTGALVGVTLWWLERLRSEDSGRERALFDARADLLQARADAAEAEAARARIALQLLQAQVEPHFLYNALANLRYLVRHDAELAQRLVDQLVRYFRVALPSLRQVEVSLAQELELCTAFGAIQALRVGDGLRLDIDVAADLRGARVPPAVLLTLVENAFKHAVPMTGVPALVTLDARRVGDELHLRVVDNGQRGDGRPAADVPGSGMGLRWLTERLQVVYGDRARMCLERRPEGCHVHLVLPFDQRAVP